MATKRKVTEILDSITGDTKEETVAVGPRAAKKRLTNISSKIIKGVLREPTATPPSKEIPRVSYAPWSRELFLDRLSTYTYRNWTIPSSLTEINAVECAERGWKCTGTKNTLQCVQCLQLLNINVGDNSKPEVQAVLASKYKEMIVSEHRDTCQWKRKGCSDDIYGLLLTNTVQKNAVNQRYTSFRPIIDYINEFNVVFDSELDMEDLVGVVDDPRPNLIALKFSLLGWKLLRRLHATNMHQIVITCDMCFRKAILSRVVDLEEQEGDNGLNLISEHMSYCPYITVHESGLSGWQEILRILKGSSMTNKSASKLTDDLQVDEDEDDKKRQSRLSKLRSIYFTRKIER
jgi:hypothetical protein